VQKKWDVLSKKLIAAGIYRGSRLAPRHLSSRYYAGRAVIRETCEEMGDRTILAYTAIWPTELPEWSELGTVWVSPELRGNGLVCKLMHATVNLLDTNFFLITDRESVMKAALQLGFIPATTQSKPGITRWASDVGVVCRLPETIYPVSPSRGDIPPTWATPERGKRWMFVREKK